MQPLEVTIIVAATRNMGIGAAGGMPWKGLRKEMQYFTRVTSRLPPQSPPGAVNAVIMGRKTWDSIPLAFRPLKGRLNIIISRSYTSPPSPPPPPPPPPPPTSSSSSSSSSSPPVATATDIREPVRVPSIQAALQYAQHHCGSDRARVFVMGGGQIYDAALKSCPQVRRVLLTSIDAEYDCDTLFPIQLGGEDGTTEPGWFRVSDQAWRAWTGEGEQADGLPHGRREEAGVKYEFQMWEKQDIASSSQPCKGNDA